MRALPTASLLLVVVVATTGCPSRAYRRAGIGPAFSPGNRNGRAMEHMAEATLTALGGLDEPAPGADDESSLAVPRRHVSLAVRASNWLGYDLGFLWDQGIGHVASSAAVRELDPGDREVFGFGFTVHSGAVAPKGFGMGGEVQVLSYIMPYILERECLSNCSPTEPADGVYTGRAWAPVFMFTLTPSYRAGPLTVFGSFAIRNHVSIEAASVEAADTGVDMGPVMLSLGLGAEVATPLGIRLGAQVFQPFGSDPILGAPPIDYGVTAMLWITAPLAPMRPRLRPPPPPKPISPDDDYVPQELPPRKGPPPKPTAGPRKREPKPVRPPVPPMK